MPPTSRAPSPWTGSSRRRRRTSTTGARVAGAAIKAVSPAPRSSTTRRRHSRLLRGFIDMKLCKGRSTRSWPDECTSSSTCTARAMVGLDVHDAGDYMRKGKWRKLQPAWCSRWSRGATSAPPTTCRSTSGHRRAHRGRRPLTAKARDPHRRLPQARGRRRGGGPRLSGRGPMEQGDVAIGRGGPVGAALAALLVPGGRSVRVLEARSQPSRDARTLALSQASREVLEDAGGWPETGVTPIVDIHVSQKGGPGRTLITAAEQGLDALGYTVSYAALESVLEARLAAVGAGVSWGTPCEAIELGERSARIALAGGGPWWPAAGARRRRRQRAAIPVSPSGKGLRAGRDHGAVRTDRPHRGRAFERSRRGVRRVLRSAIASPSCGPRAGRSARLSRSTMPRSCRSCCALRRSRRAVRRGRPGLVDLKLSPSTPRRPADGDRRQRAHAFTRSPGRDSTSDARRRRPRPSSRPNPGRSRRRRGARGRIGVPGAATPAAASRSPFFSSAPSWTTGA